MPTKPEAVNALVITGFSKTFSENVCAAFGLTPLFAVSCSGYVPAVCGSAIPLRLAVPSPLSVKLTPPGNAPGVLRAFDAESLQELWNSEQQPRRNRLGTLVKFNPPTVIAGRVYVPNYDNAVNVYGLLAR